MEDPLVLKNEGNSLFKDGKYLEALICYTKALKLNVKEDSDKAVIFKNEAACLLKLEKYSECAIACSRCLELSPNDTKALFRRCQAFEKMERYEDAYKDAMTLVRLDPKNTALQPILRRLSPIIQDKIKIRDSTDSKVSQMFDLSFGEGDDEEKKKTAANNLIVLARESAGAEKIFKSGGVKNLIHMLDFEKDKELKLTAIRVLACLAKDHKERALSIFDEVGIKKICIYIGQDDEQISTAMANVMQTVLLSVTSLDKLRKERDAHEAERLGDRNKRMLPWITVDDKICAEGIGLGDLIFEALIFMINQYKVSRYGRDNTLELIIKFVTRKDGIGWSNKFVSANGLQNLLEVAGTIPEHKSLAMTANTRMHTSLALQKIYDDLRSDKERDAYRESVNQYFSDMFTDNILDSKLEAVMALASLLQGPYEVGNMVLAREGILEMMLVMADSGNIIHTKYAVEALVHSASKKERCSGVIKQATPILKKLYQSNDDSVKVRALVGLCKLGSFGGGDASAKSFAEGSTQTLAKACRKFLCNAAKDVDLRKWAAEGLAYLSLDADVKHELVGDSNAVHAMLELAKLKERAAIYPVAQILVNVTNSYDVKEVEPELKELAKFAKHHIPEDHEKDKDEFVKERVNQLVKAGTINALVALSDTDSESARELLSRVFQAIAMNEEHRGLLIQQGGAKALIPLALKNNTDHGKTMASQALAKIAITNNPAIAFPGQRSCEVVKPLIQLCHVNCTSLQNYEALLALTNIASMNDTVRKRIMTDKGFSFIDHYMYDEHEMLRRGAVECICNLVMNKEAADHFAGNNDRVKLLVLYCGEDDLALVRGASGALAILSTETIICHKIITATKQWCSILCNLAAAELPDLQHRAVYILLNIMTADRELAQRLVDSPVLEVLMALSMLKDPVKEMAIECAKQALDKAVEWDLIKPDSKRRKDKPKKVASTTVESNSKKEESKIIDVTDEKAVGSGSDGKIEEVTESNNEVGTEKVEESETKESESKDNVEIANSDEVVAQVESGTTEEAST